MAASSASQYVVSYGGGKTVRCPRCGNSNPETNRFCGMCGGGLRPATSAPPAPPRPVPPAPSQSSRTVAPEDSPSAIAKLIEAKIAEAKAAKAKADQEAIAEASTAEIPIAEIPILEDAEATPAETRSPAVKPAAVRPAEPMRPAAAIPAVSVPAARPAASPSVLSRLYISFSASCVSVLRLPLASRSTSGSAAASRRRSPDFRPFVSGIK